MPYKPCDIYCKIQLYMVDIPETPCGFNGATELKTGDFVAPSCPSIIVSFHAFDEICRLLAGKIVLELHCRLLQIPRFL
jgi:hypothetical protein